MPIEFDMAEGFGPDQYQFIATDWFIRPRIIIIAKQPPPR